MPSILLQLRHRVPLNGSSTITMHSSATSLLVLLAHFLCCITTALGMQWFITAQQQ
jgi:hypothetical protein